MPPFAQVAVLAHLGSAGGLYTYRVPERLETTVALGSLVSVPFGSRQLQGVVCSFEPDCLLPRVRDIDETLDSAPVVTDNQLRLARWICEYYCAPISDVIGAMLPPGLGRDTRYLLEPGEAGGGRRLSAEQSRVLEAVTVAGYLAESELERTLGDIDVARAVRLLVKRGILVRTAELAPPRTSTRRVRIVSATPEGLIALEGKEQFSRAPRQRQVLELVAIRGSMPAPALTQLIPGATSTLGALERKGLVRVALQEVSRSQLQAGVAGIGATQPLTLAPAQRMAFDAIAASIRARRPAIYLLHGVTGSGKTEVYLQAIASAIQTGRQAIVMVPEISLTPQAVERVAGRFLDRVAVLHSRLSEGERLDEWQRIRRGDVDVVVGPRSALFAPLPRPGLIVVDEEHDPSYKQDSSPRYHARDAAAVLARIANATVVFGSATPDVGTYQAARAGRIQLLELPDRPVWQSTDGSAARPMPPVEVVDMRHELKAGNRGIFSTSLLHSIEKTLRDGHQALLFLNRRGSATVVLCRDCGFVVRCPSCDIPFTYHSAGVRLICHRCDRRRESPRDCPGCHGPHIRYLGTGTQRVEEEVRRLFPSARTLRWDRDVTGGRDAHAQILRRFSRHEADMLIGTQMIAKGLDFPLVTLVGVISADTGLHMPDFRAPERSFQLLTQVAGRAGRASLPSTVIVQTYTPEHYAIQAARDHDYHRFYREEMSFRRSAWYPPFARLIRFVYTAKSENDCRHSATKLRAILQQAIDEGNGNGDEIIGPAPCFVARVNDRYFWQLIARSRLQPGASTRSHSGLHYLLDHVPPGWKVDVDPVDLL